MSDAGADASTEPDDDSIVVADDGTTLPMLDVLTGRGFVTGKSGSGKSNSANVVIEGLLAAGHSLLILDIDGEYWGLKERYPILHAGAGGRCDVTVDASDAETIVDVALGGQPVILDLSGFLRADDSDALLNAVLERLFRRETEVKQPFLLVVEEVHEFIPQQGSRDDVGDILLQIAKRGRKHGLGLLGLSQRPAAVDKDFITQCDWLLWHKLTWDNDTDVVRRLLGGDAADAITNFEPGEAFLRTDWDDETHRVQFREKQTYDAGTTPGMGERNTPSLIAVDDDVLARFERERSVADEGDTQAETASSDGGSTATASATTATDTGATPADNPGAASSAVEMLVEFASMLAHLVVRAVQALFLALVRAETVLLQAIDDRTDAVGEDGFVSLSVLTWLLRAVVALVVVALVLVIT